MTHTATQLDLTGVQTESGEALDVCRTRTVVPKSLKYLSTSQPDRRPAHRLGHCIGHSAVAG